MRAAELAFRALVERHGPMVLRVCRAVLRDAHDADDAFQATFLVLVRRAGSLWVRDSLGPWLHQVAYRTASCARSAAARRRQHELRAAEFDGSASMTTAIVMTSGRWSTRRWAACRQRYREAVVLCLLEGLTPEQAARHLNCPVGTVHSRLARGREQLRGRLTRRGLAVPAGLLAVGWARNGVSAAVPPALVDSTIRAALRLAAGQVSAGAVPASVAALTGMILRTMLMAKIRVTVATLLMLGVLAVGAGVLARRSRETESRARHNKSRERDRSTISPLSFLSRRPNRPPPIPSATPCPRALVCDWEHCGFARPRSSLNWRCPPMKRPSSAVGDELIVWDAATGKERWRAHGREYGFELSNRRLLTDCAPWLSRPTIPDSIHPPGRQNEVVVWETSSGRHEVLTVASPDKNTGEAFGPLELESVDITPDGKKLAVGSAGGVVVCDLQGKVLYEIANAADGPFKVDENDRLTFVRPLQPRAFLAGRKDTGRGHE